MEMTIREWLRIQEPDFYREGIFKFVPRWDKCNNVFGVMLKNNDKSVVQMNGIEHWKAMSLNVYDPRNLTYVLHTFVSVPLSVCTGAIKEASLKKAWKPRVLQHCYCTKLR
jgi:hypothetical protein